MKQLYKIINIIILCVCLNMFSSISAAELLLPDGLTIQKNFSPGIGKPVGKVRFVQGKVYIVHDKKNEGYLTSSNIPLYTKDTIFVMEMSRINLVFNDGSILTLGSNTRLTLSKIDYIPSKKQRVSYLNMGIGKGRFRVQEYKKYKNSSFRVKTPTAIVGVRGSDFIIRATLTKTSVETLKHTKLTLLSLAALTKKPVLLDEYEWAFVEIGILPSEVKSLTLEEIESILKEFSLEDNEYTVDDVRINENTVKSGETYDESQDDSDSIIKDQPDMINNEIENQESSDNPTNQIIDNNLLTGPNEQASDQDQSTNDANQTSDSESEKELSLDQNQGLAQGSYSESFNQLLVGEKIDQQSDKNTYSASEDTYATKTAKFMDSLNLSPDYLNVANEKIDADLLFLSNPLEQIPEEQTDIALFSDENIIDENSNNLADIQLEISEEQKETSSKMPWFPGQP